MELNRRLIPTSHSPAQVPTSELQQAPLPQRYGTDTILHPGEAALGDCTPKVSLHMHLLPTPAAIYPRSAGRVQTLKLKGLSSLSTPNPPVCIPEESGQSLVRDTVGGADPTQGQEQGRSLGLSARPAAEAWQPTPGAVLSGDLGTQHLLELLPLVGPRAGAQIICMSLVLMGSPASFM